MKNHIVFIDVYSFETGVRGIPIEFFWVELMAKAVLFEASIRELFSYSDFCQQYWRAANEGLITWDNYEMILDILNERLIKSIRGVINLPLEETTLVMSYIHSQLKMIMGDERLSFPFRRNVKKIYQTVEPYTLGLDKSFKDNGSDGANSTRKKYVNDEIERRNGKLEHLIETLSNQETE